MKKEVINLSWWVTKSAHSLAAFVFLTAIIATVVLGLLFGFSKLVPDSEFITSEMATSLFSWLKISGISAAVALVCYFILSPFISPLRVLSRRDIIDLERTLPSCAYAKVLGFYTEVGTINQKTVNRMRRVSEENDLEILRQRYLGND